MRLQLYLLVTEQEVPFTKFIVRSTLFGTVKVDTPKDLHASSSSSFFFFFFVLKYAALIEYCCLSHNVLTSNMDGDVSTAC